MFQLSDESGGGVGGEGVPGGRVWLEAAGLQSTQLRPEVTHGKCCRSLSIFAQNFTIKFQPSGSQTHLFKKTPNSPHQEEYKVTKIRDVIAYVRDIHSLYKP